MVGLTWWAQPKAQRCPCLCPFLWPSPFSLALALSPSPLPLSLAFARFSGLCPFPLALCPYLWPSPPLPFPPRNLALSLQLADLVTNDAHALYADFEPTQQLPRFLRQLRQSSLALLAATREPFPV